ncbi:hypothetical protein ABFW14_25465 [Mycolicibacterium fortuitum]|uniref:Uncharacterized protein n=1 Tax=Mycolicibacterium septicum DSM 44393 TaxID=1341646 RepID=A0A7X6MV96_9MYCO|nr:MULTISPECIES: hypothetical protein [Mycolicibacterium]MBX8688790.1 hypothetical protein [Mycobacterium sp. 20091114027_K0903767]MCP3811164.1 hypothetical protein [Mycobacteriaceae bacterium Msp059]NKZ14929.1 hypothetical protein [Mycolicibacterium septicum DSM 44393]
MSFVAAITIVSFAALVGWPLLDHIRSHPVFARALEAVADDWLAVERARENPPL